MSSQITGDFGTLSVETELIDVTSGLQYPDESWTFTDAQGHDHRWAGPPSAQQYPTLTWVIDATYWCEDCRDEHTDGHYACHLCGEEIEPGLAGPDLFKKYIPGLTSYYLNDEPITKERGDEIIARWREAQP